MAAHFSLSKHIHLGLIRS